MISQLRFIILNFRHFTLTKFGQVWIVQKGISTKKGAGGYFGEIQPSV